MKIHSIRLLQTRAAAMAAATRGRKTTFKPANVIRNRLIDADYEEEIQEALFSFRKTGKVE